MGQSRTPYGFLGGNELVVSVSIEVSASNFNPEGREELIMAPRTDGSVSVPLRKRMSGSCVCVCVWKGRRRKERWRRYVMT